MNSDQRFKRILHAESAGPVRQAAGRWLTWEVNTSCPHVPIGLVRVVRTETPALEESPEVFWSRCLGNDNMLDLQSARIRPLEVNILNEILLQVLEDLARVHATESFAFPEALEERLEVDNACSSCSGCVLLLRSPKELMYVHWHRES